MIDFVKIIIKEPGLIKSVWSNPELIYHSEENQRVNDEIRTIETKKYIGLSFLLFDNRLEIRGSLHKYFNSGIHNTNDFSFFDSLQVVLELQRIFGLDLQLCKVVNLEYGLNIIPSKDVKYIITNLIYHGRNEFRFISDVKYAKQSGSFNSRDMLNSYKLIKAYAKGHQQFNGLCYGNYNTFRFEVKSKQSKYLKKHGIVTMADLTNPMVYLHLADELEEEWSNVLLLEPNLREDQNPINKYTNADFWKSCLASDNRNKFHRAKRSYLKMLENYDDNTFTKIRCLLHDKLNFFKNQINNGADPTTHSEYQGANSTREISHDGADSTTLLNSESANSTIVKVDSAPERCCLVTGIDISMQDPNSKFLTPIGLKWLYNNAPEAYEKVKLRFLPRSGISGVHTKHERNEFKHIAKQIRNHYHNPKRYIAIPDLRQMRLF